MNKLSRDLGIEYPVFAFSHCRDVVAAVSKSGGMGVLGIVAMDPEEIHVELEWLTKNCGGRPFGVDVVIPVETVDRSAGLNDAASVAADMDALIPQAHRDFAEALMEKYGVPPQATDLGETGLHSNTATGFTAAGGSQQVDAVLEHSHALLVSALGPPPVSVIEKAHAKGIAVGSLVGKPGQAEKTAALGVDLVVCQSYEAAAHTGEIGSMVLIPDVVDVVGDVPVVAAGGIGSGRQMAAAMSLGAQGVWTGSIWLTSAESSSDPKDIDRMLTMASTDTVRSRAQTGKPNRQMRTAWTEAWDDASGPGALPMPLQYLLYAEYTQRARRAGVRELVGMPVGQVVSRMNKVRPVSEIMLEMVEEYVVTLERMAAQLNSFS